MNESPLVLVSSFTRQRHKENTEFTHYKYSIDSLCSRILKKIKNNEYRQGYREGVILVSLDEIAYDFFTHTDFPMFEGMKLKAEYKRTIGREHEPPKICVTINEPKQPCKHVDVVLYKNSVLHEGEDNNIDYANNWNIVSINGRLKKEEKPMNPLTIVRNYLNLPGGAEMKGCTDKEVLDMLCKSILYENGIEYEK